MNFNRFIDFFDPSWFLIFRTLLVSFVIPVFFIVNCAEEDDDDGAGAVSYESESRSRSRRRSRSRKKSKSREKKKSKNKKNKKAELRKQARMDSARCQFKPPEDKKGMVEKGAKEYKTLYGISNEKAFGRSKGSSSNS